MIILTVSKWQRRERSWMGNGERKSIRFVVTKSNIGTNILSTCTELHRHHDLNFQQAKFALGEVIPYIILRRISMFFFLENHYPKPFLAGCWSCPITSIRLHCLNLIQSKPTEVQSHRLWLTTLRSMTSSLPLNTPLVPHLSSRGPLNMHISRRWFSNHKHLSFIGHATQWISPIASCCGNETAENHRHMLLLSCSSQAFPGVSFLTQPRQKV